MDDGERTTKSNKKKTQGRYLPFVGSIDSPSSAPLFLFLQGVNMKRFTETLIWDDPWYRKMPLKYKLLWKYLCDKCDNAGVWVKDMETAAYFIGEEINEAEALRLINNGKERIKVLTDDKWYIKEFIEFQFGNISSESNIGKSIVKLIEKYNVTGIEHPFDGRRTAVRQDISKGKGIGKGIGIGRCANKFTPPTLQEISDYVKTKKYTIDPKTFFDYFTESGWVDSKGNKVKNWKQKIITWQNHQKNEKRGPVWKQP